MEQNNTVRDLEVAFFAAKDVARTLQTQYDSLVSDMKRDAEHKILLFADALLSKELAAAHAAKRAAQSSLTGERERLALVGVNAPFPIGTKLQKTTGGTYNKKTVYGILEAVTSSTVFPDNIADYRRPHIGTFLVRLLKQDGSPSLRIDSSLWWWTRIDADA